MKKYFFLFFFIISSSISLAEEKIFYLDINYILSESDAGIYINNELNKINKKNIEEFKKVENSIKSEEEKLIAQKNIIKEDEFNSRVDNLKNKYKSYQKMKSTKNNDLKVLRDNAGNQLLKIINEILGEYSAKNKISLIMEKKNVVIGKSELDITKIILDLLNKKIKKVQLTK